MLLLYLLLNMCESGFCCRNKIPEVETYEEQRSIWLKASTALGPVALGLQQHSTPQQDHTAEKACLPVALGSRESE